METSAHQHIGTSTHLLAQLNIGRMLAPIDSPVMKGFVDNLDRINELAEKSDGFVWRLKDDSNNATSTKVYGDDLIIVNLTVWRDINALFNFAYKTEHVEIFRRRHEWFEKMSEMHMALWYVPHGHIPSVEEAIERLDYLRKHGETDHAFTFKRMKQQHHAH